MPPEPKRPIEELLDASAQARRAEFGADPKMPNPMRARLHDEIARIAKENEPKTSAPWLGTWWPRIAIGAAMAALVVGAPVVWWHARQTTGDSFRLAMDQTEATKEMKRLETPSLPVQSTPQTQPELDKTLSGSTSATAADQHFAESSVGFAEIAKDSTAEALSGAKPLAAPSTSTAFAKNRQMETGNFRQQFSQNSANQTLRREAKLQQAADVLNNFQVEQDGLQIRVVDADGSTYTGKIERLAQSDARNLEKQNYAAPSSRAALPKPARDADESANNEFYFHATGYNGSLKKSLVFEGNYVVVASPQDKAHEAAASKSGEQMPARIVGTAKIHGEPPVRVDAVSIPTK